MPNTVKIISDYSILNDADIIVFSINAQQFKHLLNELDIQSIKNKIILLCMKGIDNDTNLRLSEIAATHFHFSNKIAVWLGPGHVEKYTQGHPNCMVIDSLDNDTKHFIANHFNSDLIRFYIGDDLIGNELGAALKNVIGIATGMLDGLGMGALKGALMCRGTKEVSKLIKAMGGNEISAYGLSHLGDYEATVFSKFSNNRAFGEAFITDKNFTKLAEGYYTSKAVYNLSKLHSVSMPICESVYNVLYNDANPTDELSKLFLRVTKYEFE